GCLSDMQFAPDGDTMDPAVWYDWLNIIADCKKISRKELSEKNTILTVQENFIAVIAYIDFLCKLIESEDLCNCLSKMKFSLDKGPSSSLIWKDFLEAVKKVQTTPLKKLIEENTIRFV
ncbi:MAG: hypothetical protein K2X94_04620, partial [Amoebophilaceae bacterium]|nr:hypothetical protein [Amoebophilaceae bacterium]